MNVPAETSRSVAASAVPGFITFTKEGLDALYQDYAGPEEFDAKVQELRARPDEVDHDLLRNRAEVLARMFHETYSALMPDIVPVPDGQQNNMVSSWAYADEGYQRLMIAAMLNLLQSGVVWPGF